MPRFHALPLLALSLVFFAACGDDDASGDETEAGELTVTVAFEEAAAVGQNTMIVTVTDEAGEMVVDATVSVDPQMPMMGHGSPEEAVVANNGDGTYTAFPVTLSMAGQWVITIDASSGDAVGQFVETIVL